MKDYLIKSSLGQKYYSHYFSAKVLKISKRGKFCLKARLGGPRIYIITSNFCQPHVFSFRNSFWSVCLKLKQKTRRFDTAEVLPKERDYLFLVYNQTPETKSK